MSDNRLKRGLFAARDVSCVDSSVAFEDTKYSRATESATPSLAFDALGTKISWRYQLERGKSTNDGRKVSSKSGAIHTSTIFAKSLLQFRPTISVIFSDILLWLNLLRDFLEKYISYANELHNQLDSH